MTGITGKGKKTNEKKETIKTSIKKVIEEFKLSSASEVSAKLKELYGMDVSRQYISRVLSELSADIKYVFTIDERRKLNEYNNIVKSMNKIFKTAKLDADRIKSHNTMLKALKTRNELEFQLIAQKLIKMEAVRPNYLIEFYPTSAKYTCSKCGYTTFIKGDKKGGWVEVKTTDPKKLSKANKETTSKQDEQDKRTQNMMKELDKAKSRQQQDKIVREYKKEVAESDNKPKNDPQKTKEKPYRI